MRRRPAKRIVGLVGTRWSGDGPPVAAYGRVSDTDRLAGLHDSVAQLLRELETKYAVTRETTTEHGRRGTSQVPAVTSTEASGKIFQSAYFIPAMTAGFDLAESDAAR